MTRASYVQAGLLIDGVEFIPQDIADKHYPFAVPPDVNVEALFRRVDVDAE